MLMHGSDSDPLWRVIQMTLRVLVLALVISVTMPLRAGAEELKVAVASNFLPAMHQLARRYQADSGNIINVISGSSGKHYAQIRHGAPFDLFFSADQERPELLEQHGLAVAGSRFTYGLGRLVLWSPTLSRVDALTLSHSRFNRLAIANPRLAPYGRAAQQVLTALGEWQNLEQRLVRGENIGQTLQFVATGNAELGLIAASQLMALPGGASWMVPPDLYTPIKQQAVLLIDSAAARDFLTFVRGAEGASIIRRYGYATH